MNTRRYGSLVFAVLTLLALTVFSAAAQSRPAKQLPAEVEMGESASPAANLNESEPNNTFASADVIAIGDVVSAKIRPAGDVDIYRLVVGTVDEFITVKILIDVDAASQGSPLDSHICLYDEWYDQLGCNDDSDGLDSLLFAMLNGQATPYYIEVRDSRADTGGSSFTYKLALYSPVLLSAAGGGSVAGVSFRPEDILAHYDFPDGTEKWMIFFDGSDVGISQNVSAFAAGSFLTLAFQRNQYIGDLQATVTPKAYVWFEISNAGADTAGEFTNHLQPDHLEKASERLDAIGDSYYWGVDVSPVGGLLVPNLYGEFTSARDEDLLSGALEYSTWAGWDPLAFDGSRVPGLAAEDVIAASRWNNIWYLTILGSGTIDGHAYNQKDIFMVDGETYEVLGRYWNGPAHHFNYNLDAIDVGE